MANQPLVTVVIKARNEERQILECIASLSGLADEIIVVDDASTDNTRQVAQSAGARVITGEPHQGFIDRLDAQGFLAATGRYLLRLDADERPTPGLASTLRSIAEAGDASGVRYARRYYFFDGWLDHGGWFRSQQLGFFRADAWERDWDCSVHSQVPVRGRIITLPARLDNCMLHFDYFTVDEFAKRSLAKYAKLEAYKRAELEPRFSAARMASRVVRRSAGRYLLRAGYRDGARGAVVAGLLGAYEACVEAYAWEIRRQRVLSGKDDSTSTPRPPDQGTDGQ